eukprot:m51a1_g1565 hypothetical protein (1561) ;mRNA; r:53983-59681
MEGAPIGTVATVVCVEEPTTTATKPEGPSAEPVPVPKPTEFAPAVTKDPKSDPAGDHMTPRHWALFVEVVVLSLGVMYVETCLIPALPNIQKQFEDQVDWIPWILSSYNIIGAVWTSISGCLSDLYGPKWITVINLCIYMVGQVIAALSKRSIFMLIAGRALQGFGMAIFVLAMNIVRQNFPASATNGLMAVISAVMSIGMSVGIIGGAAELEHMEWNIMFWVTLPIIAVFVVAFIFTMPGPNPLRRCRKCNQNEVVSASAPASAVELTAMESAESPHASETAVVAEPPRKPSLSQLDVLGAILLAAGVIMLLMGLTFSETWGWKAAGTLILVIAGPAILIGLVAWEFRCKAPLLPVRVLIARDQLMLCFVSVFSGIAQFSLFQMLPYLYTSPLADIKATRMMVVGELLLPFGIATFVMMPIAIAMGRYTGYPPAVLLANALGTLGIGLMIPFHSTKAQAVLLNCVAGAGVGMSSIAVINMVSAITPKLQFGSVSGANMLLRFVGGSLGPVFVNLIMSRYKQKVGAYEFYEDKAFVNGFAFLTGVMGFVTVGSLLLPRLCAVATPKGREKLAKAREAPPMAFIYYVLFLMFAVFGWVLFLDQRRRRSADSVYDVRMLAPPSTPAALRNGIASFAPASQFLMSPAPSGTPGGFYSRFAGRYVSAAPPPPQQQQRYQEVAYQQYGPYDAVAPSPMPCPRNDMPPQPQPRPPPAPVPFTPAAATTPGAGLSRRAKRYVEESPYFQQDAALAKRTRHGLFAGDALLPQPLQAQQQQQQQQAQPMDYEDVEYFYDKGAFERPQQQQPLQQQQQQRAKRVAEVAPDETLRLVMKKSRAVTAPTRQAVAAPVLPRRPGHASPDVPLDEFQKPLTPRKRNAALSQPAGADGSGPSSGQKKKRMQQEYLGQGQPLMQQQQQQQSQIPRIAPAPPRREAPLPPAPPRREAPLPPPQQQQQQQQQSRQSQQQQSQQLQQQQQQQPQTRFGRDAVEASQGQLEQQPMPRPSLNRRASLVPAAPTVKVNRQIGDRENELLYADVAKQTGGSYASSGASGARQGQAERSTGFSVASIVSSSSSSAAGARTGDALPPASSFSGAAGAQGAFGGASADRQQPSGSFGQQPEAPRSQAPVPSSSSSGFSFGDSVAPAAPASSAGLGFSFADKPAPSSAAPAVPSARQPSSSSSSSSSFAVPKLPEKPAVLSFGDNKPPSSSSAFGETPAAAPETKQLSGGFSFGASRAPDAQAEPGDKGTGFSFGGSKAAEASAASTSALMFGGQPAPSSSSSSAAAAGGSFSFPSEPKSAASGDRPRPPALKVGSGASAQPSVPSMFGGDAAPSSSSSAAAADSVPRSGSFSFGIGGIASASSAPSSSSSSALPSAGMFGAAAPAPSSSGSSLFGVPPPGQSPTPPPSQSPATGLLAAPSSGAAVSASLFGGSDASSAAPSFGVPGSAGSSTALTFGSGSSASTGATGAGLFGSAAAPAEGASSAFSFGASAAGAAPASSMFGAASSSSLAFGTPSAGAPSGASAAFGSPGAPLFGAQPAGTPLGAGMFSAGAPPAASSKARFKRK